MVTAALFALGVLLGGAAVFASFTGRRAVARSAPGPARDERLKSITPVSVLLGDETREIQTYTDVNFASLSMELLDDVRAQHSARAAAIWGFHDGRLMIDLVTGDRAAVVAAEQMLSPLLEWSAHEGVAQLGPDGDAPIAAVAPLGVRGGRPMGSLALLFAGPFRGDRTDLKNWMLRHGRRIGLVTELVRTHAELAKTNKRTRMMLRETQNWDVEERPVDLGVRLCGIIEQMTGAEGAALVRWDETERRGVVVVADGSCAQYADSTVDDDSLAGTACREDVPQIWHEVSGRGEGPEALFARSSPTQTGCVLVQPLRRRGMVIGAVVAVHHVPGALGPAELRALSLFDAVTSFRLASAWKLEEVRKRALVDGLTGVANRVGFEAEMADALAEQTRFGWEVSLVLVDVDHFKHVNDSHGHKVGDTVLRAIANTLEQGIRATDVCARVGGEEMALILRDTGFEGASELAERLRVDVEALRVRSGTDEIKVTASFGIGTYPTEVSEWSELYAQADRALYAAKAAGRNRVVGGGTARSEERGGRSEG